jgi:hypothetical protein
MTIASHLRVLVVAMSVATGAQAQSTSRLGQEENPLRLELSAGFDHSSSNNSYGGPGTVLTGAAAVRWSPPTGWAGVRATLFGIQRRSHYFAQYSATDSDDIEREDRVVALALSADASFRIWRDLTVAPAVGAGFSPYVHGQQTVTRTRNTPSTAPNPFDDSSPSENGAIWTAGVALRYRHLVIEKQVIGLLGANNSVGENREYYPLSIGFRF